MSGAVTGSTMDLVAQGQIWGAIKINTGCNLNCPICYLGEKKSNQTMSMTVAKRLSHIAQKECWSGITIIGTEPLLDESSVQIINAFAPNKTHIITNGINLEKYAEKLCGVARIDISLDGGPRTYQRSKSFASIKRGVNKWSSVGNSEVVAINTLYRENIHNIDDMLEGSRQLGVQETFFSPYVKTLGGQGGATPLKTAEIVQALLPFANENWKLMIDPYHAIFEWREWDMIKDDAKILPEKNLLIVDFDPGDGVRRIGINGTEDHPFLALHPGIKLSGRTII